MIEGDGEGEEKAKSTKGKAGREEKSYRAEEKITD